MAIKHMHRALAAVNQVLLTGDRKYGEEAWRNGNKNDDNQRKHIAGLKRHLAKLEAGEEIDESGEPHLAHVVARGILAMQFRVEEHPRKECREEKTEKSGRMLVCTRGAGHHDKAGHYDAIHDVEWQ